MLGEDGLPPPEGVQWRGADMLPGYYRLTHDSLMRPVSGRVIYEFRDRTLRCIEAPPENRAHIGHVFPVPMHERTGRYYIYLGESR